MKQLNKAILFPKDFKETVVVLHLNPAFMLQFTLAAGSFYRQYATYSVMERELINEKINSQMAKYQSVMSAQAGKRLFQLNTAHLARLAKLSNAHNISAVEASRKGKYIIRAWGRKVDPLLQYPRKILLENGQTVHIGFDFFLWCLTQGATVNVFLRSLMQRFSLTVRAAHLASAGRTDIGDVNKLMAIMQQSSQLYVNASPAEIALRAAWQIKYDYLLDRISMHKTAALRLPIVREFMGQWYKETLKLDAGNRPN